LPKCVGKNFGIQREKEDIPLQPEVEHNMNKTKKIISSTNKLTSLTNWPDL
jgi:hypothetical protein